MRESRSRVQVGRSSSFGRFLPGVIADKRHKTAAFHGFRRKLAGALFDKLELLIVGVAHRNDHAATVGKLRKERPGSGRSCRGDEDGVERRKFRQAERAVPAMEVHVAVAEALKFLRSGGSQLSAALDGEDFLREK